MRELTPKQQRFVEEYLKDLNATQAAIRAGYSKKTAYRIGATLVQKTSVAAAIDQAKKKRASRTEITAERVLRELARLAFSDVADYVEVRDDEVRVRDLTELNKDQTRCISEISDSTYRGERKRAFKLYDKAKALDMLTRHLGLYIDKSTIELSGKVDFATILRQLQDGKNKRSGD